jgi:hypothetical protein
MTIVPWILAVLLVNAGLVSLVRGRSCPGSFVSSRSLRWPRRWSDVS